MTVTQEPATEETQRVGRRWALRTAVLAMALTLLPYLFGWSLQGANASRGWFSWLGYNLDDSCVYLSWMRQAADGHFFQKNLFTTEPQLGHQFSLFFLLLGNVARLFHLPLLLVYQGSRLLLGVAFLRAVWWLLEMLVPAHGARKTAFLVVCFSAGLGWMPGWWRHSGILSPADVWQPEAITFLCLYLSPLFLLSLLLMVGVVGWLIGAERSGEMRYAVYAGLCGLLLGNVHTYDVITLMAVWGGYLIARSVQERRLDAQAWAQAVVAGLLTAISTGYMFYLVRTEDVFARRVAVPTLAPDFRLYLQAYGPLMLLALLGLWRARRAAESEPLVEDRRAMTLLAVWAIVNLAVAYLPVSFNRKMLMGEHLPLATLAGLGLYAVRGTLAKAWPALVAGAVILPVALAWSYLPSVAFAGVVPALVFLLAAVSAVRNGGEQARPWAALAAAIGLLALTNVLFTARDMDNFLMDRGQSGQRPYLYAGEVAALEWLKANAPAGAPIQPLPWVRVVEQSGTGRRQIVPDATVACFAPGVTGHPVHAGHWGETPDFGETISRWVAFVKPATTDADRVALLRETGVRYVLFTQKHDEGIGNPGDPQVLSFFRQSPPPYLRLLPDASNPDADVYEVRLP